ncbi:MAG: hypothetical protein HGA22_04665 [Clostridiales bacterium]|nr:hypothetical protein [Clostridiales bacterium]
MECTSYRKAGLFKRLRGIKGYCTSKETDIRQCSRINYPPYVCCRGTNGELHEGCVEKIKFKSGK